MVGELGPFVVIRLKVDRRARLGVLTGTTPPEPLGAETLAVDGLRLTPKGLVLEVRPLPRPKRR